MRAIELDFARPSALPRGVAAALLVAGLVALAVVLLHAANLRTQIDQLAADLESAQRAARHERQPLKPASGADRDALVQELARANRVVASLNLGWGALFKQLEAIQLAGVTLLSVQPEAGNTRRLRLGGEARRLEEALAYVRQVATAPGFANAHLVSHEVVSGGPRPALHFAFVVDWVPVQ